MTLRDPPRLLSLLVSKQKCISNTMEVVDVAQPVLYNGYGMQINAWFLENRDPETGEYPDFPDDSDAGSRIILNPPPPPPPPAPAADGKKGAKKAPEKPKGKGKGKGKFSITPFLSVSDR